MHDNQNKKFDTIPKFTKEYFPAVTSVAIRNAIMNNKEYLEKKEIIKITKALTNYKVKILDDKKLYKELSDGK